MHYLINDTDFTKMLKFFDQIKGIHKKDVVRLRMFIEAIFYVCRSGCQWRLLPTYYGKGRSIHKRFVDWNKKGIWKQLFEFSKNDPDLEWVMIDSTIIRSHACSAGYKKDSQKIEALGRSRGGFTTKIHAVVDALGNPINFVLTAGQRNDITQAKHLCKDISNALVLADKAYDSNNFIKSLTEAYCVPVIPPRKNRKEKRFYDEHYYKERNKIECFFGKIKHFRRIFSRYDKCAQTYLGFIYIVGALIWFK